ncbi:hypothetical protein PFISCL1PPCAC_22085, partial [Pristionchus fissidentatus]
IPPNQSIICLPFPLSTHRAPSSPPDMSVPAKRIPLAASYTARRSRSLALLLSYSLLPLSMIISPASRKGTKSIIFCTGAPTFTRINTLTRTLQLHISSTPCAPIILVPFASFA